MKVHALRLLPHQDLKKELLNWSKKNKIAAACLLTCVGSLNQAHLRLSNAKAGLKFLGFFEIVSLVGTFSDGAGHFHISIANENGEVIGGHLLDENIIHTTAEIVIAELTNYEFKRELDAQTNYQELVITKKNNV